MTVSNHQAHPGLLQVVEPHDLEQHDAAPVASKSGLMVTSQCMSPFLHDPTRCAVVVRWLLYQRYAMNLGNVSHTK